MTILKANNLLIWADCVIRCWVQLF